MTGRHVVLTVIAIVLFAGRSSAQMTVGPNVQISKGNSKDMHSELYAGADPANPQRLIACSMLESRTRPTTNTVVYVSQDGGTTWQQTLRPDDIERTGDPVCAFGPDGTAYYLALAAYTGKRGEMLVYRSRDGGKSWTAPLRMPIIDREGIVFDSTGGKYNGRGYINGTGSSRAIDNDSLFATDLTLFRSMDGFATFSGPVKRAALGKTYVLGMGNSVVLSDGTVVSLFGDLKDYWQPEGRGEVKESRRGSPNAVLKVVRSEDGGETLEVGSTVSDWYMDRDRSQGSHIPALAVDPGSAAFKDRLYAVWSDGRSGRLEVLLSYSADLGRTWSRPVVVNDDRPASDPAANGPDAITPVVAVSKAGVVGVAWADRRDHPDNLGWYKRFSASLDGGETFLPSVRVSSAPNAYGEKDQWPLAVSASGGGTPLRPGVPRPSKPTPLTFRVGVHFFNFSEGHTGGLAVDAKGVFHPVWVDNRTGVMQMWTAPVTVAGQATKNGSTELASLAEVTGNLAVEFTEAFFDRAASTASVRVRLKNTSNESVRGPIKVRVISLKSELGVVRIMGVSAGGVGSVIDFTPQLKTGELKPGDVSGEKMLTFKLTDLRSFKQGQQLRSGLVELDTRIYATMPERPVKSDR
jgi:photosystem II stability/assembly factor-like uncharacterized protein